MVFQQYQFGEAILEIKTDRKKLTAGLDAAKKEVISATNQMQNSFVRATFNQDVMTASLRALGKSAILADNEFVRMAYDLGQLGRALIYVAVEGTRASLAMERLASAKKVAAGFGIANVSGAKSIFQPIPKTPEPKGIVGVLAQAAGVTIGAGAGTAAGGSTAKLKEAGKELKQAGKELKEAARATFNAATIRGVQRSAQALGQRRGIGGRFSKGADLAQAVGSQLGIGNEVALLTRGLDAAKEAAQKFWGVMTRGTSVSVGAWGALTTGIKGAVGALKNAVKWAFTFAMTPIGLIVTALAAVATVAGVVIFSFIQMNKALKEAKEREKKLAEEFLKSVKKREATVAAIKLQTLRLTDAYAGMHPEIAKATKELNKQQEIIKKHEKVLQARVARDNFLRNQRRQDEERELTNLKQAAEAERLRTEQVEKRVKEENKRAREARGARRRELGLTGTFDIMQDFKKDLLSQLGGNLKQEIQRRMISSLPPAMQELVKAQTGGSTISGFGAGVMEFGGLAQARSAGGAVFGGVVDKGLDLSQKSYKELQAIAKDIHQMLRQETGLGSG